MDYKIQPSACVVFFGRRFLSDTKVDAKNDPRALAARAHGLDTWSGVRYPPVGPSQPAHFLLVGDRLRIVGFDSRCEESFALKDLGKVMKLVTRQLRQAGFAE